VATKLDPSQYLNHEIRYLRKYCMSTMEETQRLERYGVVITASVWSWVATYQKNPASLLAGWIPVFAVLLLGSRALGLSRELRELRQYIKRSEGYANLPANLGWELNRSEKILVLRGHSAWYFWIVLQTVTVIGAILLNWLPPLISVSKPL
jgi:hypothetical protein